MPRPPDIAFLLDRFGSGGVERVACHLANGLQRRGFRVEMIVLEDAGPTRPLLDEQVSVHRLADVADQSRSARLKAAGPAIAQYLQDISPRLLHAPGNHTIRPAARAIALAGFRGAFVPKITNPLLPERMSWPDRWRRRKSYRRALEQAHLILLLYPGAAAQLAAVERRLLPRTRVVHNPYVTGTMLSRLANRSPADPPVILSLGRLTEQKNYALLLKAASRLGDREWRLRICGVGPEEGPLRQLADELGIGRRLELAGFVDDPVAEYLAATVMALSSRWEELPAVVLEAIACGCPVVSTASSPGLVELLREVGARRAVAPMDEIGLCRALADALDGRLPSVPREAALPYEIETACDEHARLFAGLLDEPSASAAASSSVQEADHSSSSSSSTREPSRGIQRQKTSTFAAAAPT